MLTRAPTIPAQGLHHHGPRDFDFAFFDMKPGLEKIELVAEN